MYRGGFAALWGLFVLHNGCWEASSAASKEAAETGSDSDSDVVFETDTGIDNRDSGEIATDSLETPTDLDSGEADTEISECFEGPWLNELPPDAEIDESWVPTGPYWKLVYLPIERMEILQSPPLHDGATVRLLLETTLPNDCLRLTAAARWMYSDYSRVLFTALRAWQLENGGECTGSPRKEKRILSLQTETGCWTVTDLVSAGRITFDVDRCRNVADNCACDENSEEMNLAEGESCTMDCQCAGYGSACLPVSDSKRVCGKPCAVDGDCWAGECRSESEEGFGICRPFAADECTDDQDCETTDVCLESVGVRFCRTDVGLSGTTRHECTGNDDCETPGTVCTLGNAPGGLGVGTCNLPCETALSVCPGGHSCDEVITGINAICEWGGI